MGETKIAEVERSAKSYLPPVLRSYVYTSYVYAAVHL